LCRCARDRADDQAGAAGGLPAVRVPAGARHDRLHRRPPRDEVRDRSCPAAHARPACTCRAAERRRGGIAATRALSPLTYDALVAELFPRLTGGIRWGLERTERLLAAVGDPHRSYRTLHAGGTNGKGSVAATLASVLGQTGALAGLYTSPHLCTFRERIQIGGAPIGEEQFVAAATRLWPHILRESPSFFEATTAIAFLALAEAGVEVAAIEVGLGGRLDATNVIRPDVVALTNVALDHAQYLGDTIEAVAREKAGIIKAGVPVVTA